DAYDLVGLPHVGPHLTVHTLQLIEHGERFVVAEDRDRPDLLKGLRVPEGEPGAAVAHHQALARLVVADPPTLAVVLHPADFFQCAPGTPDRVPLPPGEPPHLAADDRETLTERVVGQWYQAGHLAGFVVHLPHIGDAVLAGALVQPAVVQLQA